MFNLCNNDLKKHLLTLAYILLTVLLTAQTVSGKKDIAVFRLSHSGYVPSEIVDRIDQRIIGVITSFKRFNVIGMEYRMSSNNITSFIDHIKSTKEHQSEISETVLSGEEAFTRADWERLTSAFLIFAPRITDYDEKLMFEEAEVDGKKVIRTYWEVEIAGAVSIIDVSGSTGERVIPLSVRKIAKQRSDAVADAITSLTSSIYSAIKFEPEFALTSGILEVDRENNTVTIELGKDIGVHPGRIHPSKKYLHRRQTILKRNGTDHYFRSIRYVFDCKSDLCRPAGCRRRCRERTSQFRYYVARICGYNRTHYRRKGNWFKRLSALPAYLRYTGNVQGEFSSEHIAWI